MKEVTVSVEDLRAVLAPSNYTEVYKAAQARLEQAVKSHIPAEPPIGTILRGKDSGDIWSRNENFAGISRWAVTHRALSYTWEEAYLAGADPTRPLVDKAD